MGSSEKQKGIDRKKTFEEIKELEKDASKIRREIKMRLAHARKALSADDRRDDMLIALKVSSLRQLEGMKGDMDNYFLRIRKVKDIFGRPDKGI